MHHYCALIADIKKSRAYGPRERELMQILISEALTYLNEAFKGGIEKEVMFSAGDEVQGLFRDPVVAFLYYRMLCLFLGPDVLRGGFGLGEWDVRVDSPTSTSQDGSAYHRARTAVNEAKKNKRFDTIVRFSDELDDVLITLIDHSLGLCSMRTRPQNETALVVELLHPLSTEWQGLQSAESRRSLLKRGTEILVQRTHFVSDRRKGEGIIEGVLEHAGQESALFVQEPVILEESWNKKSRFQILEGDLVGASGSLAKLSGMSRQGIDGQLSRGRVVQERNATALLTFVLAKYVRG